ncbi:hypothetical protein MTP04_31670 [Lysinibacillus sp. PLM2]|nr:hypothetical protein MTP04_31670 [Lysinibacillus sp. PLM2]
MDIYHSWIYVNILNAPWLIWCIVIFILSFNILSPIIIWIVINGKTLPFTKNKKSNKNKEDKNNATN